MHIELVSGTTNVIRFPGAQRIIPTLDLLHDIAPDVRVVLNLADAFFLEPPLHDLRDRTDAETADFIALHVPPHGPSRAAMLKDMEMPSVRAAIDACRQAEAAAQLARDARAAANNAPDASQREELRDRADSLARDAAVLLLRAHVLAEEADGVARAVAFARSGETWVPRNHADETDALIGIGAALAR